MGDGAQAAAASDDRARVLEMRDIPANSRGIDFRALLGHWLAGASHAEVHEPYLTESWHREHLAFLLDTLRQGGVFSVDVVTMEPHGEAVFDELSSMQVGLESMVSAYAGLGFRIQLRYASFHRRRVLLHLPGGRLLEIGLDRGLHGWRRPHNHCGLTALATRRTMAQFMMVRVLDPGTFDPAVEASAPHASHPLKPVRIRQLLHDVQLLKQQQLRGRALNPAQARKLAREGFLRAAMADQRRPRQGALYCTWICANPLCGASNDVVRSRCCQSRCGRPAPPRFDGCAQSLWRRCTGRCGIGPPASSSAIGDAAGEPWRSPVSLAKWLACWRKWRVFRQKLSRKRMGADITAWARVCGSKLQWATEA